MSGQASLWLMDEIGPWGVDAKTFLADLRAIDAPELTLYVSSPGGSCWDALAMYNGLKDHPARVTVSVESVAASAASFVAMAGDHIRVRRGGQFMVHEAATVCCGTAADMREASVFLDRVSNVIAGLYAHRAGGTPEHWRSVMKPETWFSAEEAVAAGLADEAEGGSLDIGDMVRDAVRNAVGRPVEPRFDVQMFREAVLAAREPEQFVGYAGRRRFTNRAEFERQKPTGIVWSPESEAAKREFAARISFFRRSEAAQLRTSRKEAEALINHAERLIRRGRRA